MRLVALIILVPGSASNSADVSSREAFKFSRIKKSPRCIDSRRPPRIDTTIRVGRPESTERFASGDANRQSDSRRATRIGKAIEIGRPGSTKLSGFLPGLSQFPRPEMVILLNTVVLEMCLVALIILVPGRASNSANVSSREAFKFRI